MNWLRLYHGTSTDPKLHKASRAAKVSRGLFLGAWVAVLEYASQQEPRGNVADLDAATLAYLIDSPPAVAARILAAMNAAGMIEDGIIRAWAKRQRESDDVASRVRKHRQAVGDTKDRENDGGANPLNGHAAAPAGNVTETRQNRADQNREDKKDIAAAPGEPATPAQAREETAPPGPAAAADFGFLVNQVMAKDDCDFPEALALLGELAEAAGGDADLVACQVRNAIRKTGVRSWFAYARGSILGEVRERQRPAPPPAPYVDVLAEAKRMAAEQGTRH